MQSLIYLKRVGCRFRVSTAFLFQTVEKSQQFRLSRLAFCAQSSVVFLTNLCWFSRYRAIKNRTETKNYTCGYCLFDRLNKLFEKTKRKSEKKKMTVTTGGITERFSLSLPFLSEIFFVQF